MKTEFKREFFLNVIPKSFLVGILNNKFQNNKNLHKSLRLFLKKPSGNIKDMIESCSKKKIIEYMIKYKILTETEEEELFYKFRDNYSPIFYTYHFASPIKKEIGKFDNEFLKFGNLLDFDQDKKLKPIKDIENLPDKDRKYKGFQIKSITIIQGYYREIKFDYLQRFDYLDENYIPQYIYEVKWGFLWIDTRNDLVIIKTSSEAIVTAWWLIIN